MATLETTAEYTLTRRQYVDVVERVLEKMGAHFRDYEQERLREHAQLADGVTFGVWWRKPGCPLQQTGMCTTADRVDSVFELFIEHFDDEMRNTLGLRWPASEVVRIIP